MVTEGIKSGAVRPLPSTVFSDTQVETAFRFMASGKHIGKVLLKVRPEEPKKVVKSEVRLVAAIPRTYMNPDKSYVLVGELFTSAVSHLPRIIIVRSIIHVV